jgi:transposase-like protein
MVLVEQGGRAKTRVLTDVTAKTLAGHIRENVDLGGTLHTDEFAMYTNVGREFKGGHKVVKHSIGQYTVPGSCGTNMAESYFALIKRGIYGNFHHVSAKHLQRYCEEFEFRWNNREMDDTGKVLTALKQSEGKRLMYKGTTSLAGI